MPSTSDTIIGKILPFIGIGIFLVVMVIALILLSYVLLIGGAIGLILFVIAYIKNKFFPSKTKSVVQTKAQKKARIFDNDEFK